MINLKLAVVALGISAIQFVYPATVSVPFAAADGIYVAGESAKHPANAVVAISHSVHGSVETSVSSESSNPSTSERAVSVVRVKVPVSHDDSSIESVVDEYAQTHAGTYKVAVTELSGVDSHVSVDGDVPITTASTYKLFVAYSTILAIEAGEWSWSDVTTTGQDVSTCFDLMIEASDNDCAIALLEHLGNAVVQGDASDQGAIHTVFLDDDITSTADDEVLLLTKLASGALPITAADSDKWISAMKANEYRDGIPTGLSNMVVADKVGFLDDLLHDAAIVYSPKGTYALVILTEDASWADIAELASQIEAAR